MSGQYDYKWNHIIQEIRRLPPHVDKRIEFWQVDGIPDCFYWRPGDYQGQKKDYGLMLEDGSGIHVKVYSDHYEAHWDKKDPKTNPFGHLREDAPHWLAAIGIGATAIGLYAVYKWYKNR